MSAALTAWPGERGFTLVEAMVTLAVAVIVVAAGIPSWDSLVRGTALRTSAAEWMATVHAARAEAMRRGVAVTVLPQQAGGWERGWLLVRDLNGNGQADAGEERLQAFGPLPANVSMASSFPLGSLRFDASGRPSMPGTITLAAGNLQRKVVISLLGRTRVCTPPAPGASC